MSQAVNRVIEGGDQNKPLTIEAKGPLLSTKLFVPPIPTHRVDRQRLKDRLNSGLDKALILLSAPAGYGKTTLVSSWLKECGLPSAWLSLDRDDNDPIRFLQYLITALQKSFPAINLKLMGVLQDKTSDSYKLLVNILINEIATSADPFVLALDDFHAISAQPLLEIIDYIIEHLPPQAHLVIISRADPLLPLSRLRVRSQLVDIRADHLRFTQDEITHFLNDVMGLKLPALDIQALEARTEGWIAGLQLASIALQGAASQPQLANQTSGDLHGFVSAFTGSHYYIMDYLAEEVLKNQADSVRSFLLETSILDRMCGSLCDYLLATDSTESRNGQAMLEILEQMNLFIIPLDNERRWYRYHHLFADVLNRRLQQLVPHRLAELHRRASLWYEQNGYIFDAVRHALLAKDHDRAAQLVDQNGCQLLMRGEVINLLDWIKAVEPYSQALPWIAIQKGWALCLTGQPERAGKPLDTAEQLLAPLELTDDVRIMSGALTCARAFQATLQSQTRLAVKLARQALDYLPANTDFSCSLRSAATSILGDANWIEGNLKEAELVYSEAVQISQAAGNIHMNIITSSNLAEILMECGQLHQAARIYADILRMVKSPEGQISPLGERAYVGMGLLDYQWNKLQDAEDYINQGIGFSRRWGKGEFQTVSKLLLARFENQKGNIGKARENVQEAEQLISDAPHNRRWTIFAISALAQMWITHGDLEKASHLINKNGIQLDHIPEAEEISYLQEPLFVILLRLLLAQADYVKALLLSERLLNHIDAQNRVGRVIEILVLRALAFQGKKDTNEALAALEQGLSLASSDGYVRVFLDEGEPMAKLLYQIRPPRTGAGYAAELLSAMGKAFDKELPPAELLIELLTLRELEVLKLIEAGCTNQQIAAKLVISLPTVKRHISNIYAKLGADNRTQAVARGKELKLFK